ncbi:MAG: N-acetylglucosamine-6-phosphate deacetylase [Thermaceae bacterium]|nr:N-acetylglucosamine-6-phosphate deacetylase [Thermaceae bacterium]
MNELSGTVVTPTLSYPGRVRWDTHIEAVEAALGQPGGYILPGFIDLHVHGGGGADCMEGAEATRQMARFHAQHGTVALLATTVTAPLGDLEAALAGINQVIQNPGPGEARVLGVHLEGPFINSSRLGAQPPYTIPPDLGIMRHLMSLAPIQVVTLAPELPGALALIRFLSEAGIRVQMGHTGANYAQARAGFEAGAQGFTHFFNAMTGLHHREPGVVGLGLEKASFAEVVADGLHVHPAAVRAIWKAIPQLYAVTDAVEAAGMTEGKYRLGRHSVYKKAEGVFLEDGTLAGSSLTLDQAVRNLTDWGLSLGEAVEMTSGRPARYLGLENLGSLEAGMAADIVVLNEHLEVEQVYLGGQALSSSEEFGA